MKFFKHLLVLAMVISITFTSISCSDKTEFDSIKAEKRIEYVISMYDIGSFTHDNIMSSDGYKIIVDIVNMKGPKFFDNNQLDLSSCVISGNTTAVFVFAKTAELFCTNIINSFDSFIEAGIGEDMLSITKEKRIMFQNIQKRFGAGDDTQKLASQIIQYYNSSILKGTCFDPDIRDAMRKVNI